MNSKQRSYQLPAVTGEEFGIILVSIDARIADMKMAVAKYPGKSYWASELAAAQEIQNHFRNNLKIVSKGV